MIKIVDIQKLNLTVTWTLLYLGFCDNSIYGGQLSSDDVIKYAMSQIEEDNCDDLVCELAGSYASEKEDICKILKILMQKEGKDRVIEGRKIRAVLVSDVLKLKNDNYINGLMDLSDLWIRLGYPDDSPHVFQGRNNTVNVNDYYSESNYNFLFKHHMSWLKKELQYLQERQ